MAIADKLQSILDSKSAIKAAIEAKGVGNVGDILAEYPDKIASIQSGGGGACTGFTGHADVEGLKAIGWTDEDIEYYQTHGVNWNEEDDEYHKVPEDNIALYGVLTADNIQDYKDILVYCPKIDTSNRISLSNLFQKCYSLVAVPMFDTSSVTNMSYMFNYCYSLTSVPQLDTGSVTNMSYMFNYCYSLTSVPQLDTGSVTNMSYMFRSCYSIQTANIYNLKLSLDINNTSLLTKESLLYLINNEAATMARTIKLSADCYNKYSTDADVTAALANHPNVSLASE